MNQLQFCTDSKSEKVLLFPPVSSDFNQNLQGNGKSMDSNGIQLQIDKALNSWRDPLVPGGDGFLLRDKNT